MEAGGVGGTVEPPLGAPGAYARATGNARRLAQFRAVMRKNWRLRMRGLMYCCTITEVALPATFFALMCVPSAVYDDELYNDEFFRQVDLRSPSWSSDWNDATDLVVAAADAAAAGEVAKRAARHLWCGRGFAFDLTGEDAVGQGIDGVTHTAYVQLLGYRRLNAEGLVAVNETFPAQALCTSSCVDVAGGSCNGTGSWSWDLVDEHFTHTYSDPGDLETHSNANPGTVFAAVDLGDVSGDDLAYTLRINASAVGEVVEEKFAQRWEAVVPFDGWRRFFLFSNAQHAVDQALLGYKATRAGLPHVATTVDVKPYPWVDYTINIGGAIAGGFYSLIVSIAYTSSTVLVLKSIVMEKELRLREGMQMMGLSPTMYWMSWFTTHFSMMSLTALVCSLIGIYCFQYSSFLLNFIFLLVWSVSLITFNYFLSCFFDRSRMATVIGSFIHVASVVPGTTIRVELGPNGSGTPILWTGILPVGAMFNWGGALSVLEYSQHGLTFATFTESIQPEGAYMAENVLLMTCLTAVFWAAMAWYFDKVWPSQYGVKLEPWFLFTRKYWLGDGPGGASTDDNEMKRRESVAAPDHLEPLREPLTPEQEENVAVKVTNLRKRFGEVTAVDGLNVKFVNGQISGLLGHNGAGKTTSISMLTGLIPPSEGNALIHGRSILTDLPIIRDDLGMCPQFDVLWPTLTVREHLTLYAAFAGLPSEQIAAEVERKVQEVGLVEKIDQLSGSLSGGQKRKLSVAIAFIGDPKLVILDEPTSGMDPYSRRFTWDIIRKHKEKCAILLTTHFLDEADLLCDRIAIMSAGRLACAGSSVFLKSRYGAGYRLTMARDATLSDQAVEALEDRIAAIVPGAKLASDVGSELSFELPTEGTVGFPRLIDMIEAEKSQLGINSYGVSCTTLEEVFLSIANGGIGEKVDSRKAQDASGRRHTIVNMGGHVSKKRVELSAKRITGNALLWQQLKALLMKRMINWRRDRRALLTQLFIPGIFIIFSLLVVLSEPPPGDGTYPSLLITRAGVVDNKQSVLAVGPGVDSSVVLGTGNSEYELQSSPNGLAGCECFCPTKTQLDMRVDNEGWFFAGVCPPAAAESECVLSPEFKITTTSACASTVDGTHDGLLLSRQEGITTCEFEDEGACDALYVESWPAASTSASILHYKHTVMPNPSAYYSVPVALNSASTAILRTITGGTGSIACTNHPLPDPPIEREEEDDNESENGIELTVAIFMAMGTSVLTASFSTYLVWEKSNNAKHLQMVSGVNRNIFWLSNFIVDYSTFLVNSVIFTLIFVAFDTTRFAGEGIAAVFVLLIAFGWASIPMTYFMHYYFTVEMNALAGIMAFNGTLSFMFVLAGVILEAIQTANDDVQLVWDILKWVFSLLPHYCLCKGVYDVAVNEMKDEGLSWDAATMSLVQQEQKDMFDMSVTGQHLVFLFIEGFVFLGLTLYIEHTEAISKLAAATAGVGTVPPPRPGEEDEDVVAEKRRVEASRPDELQDVVQLRGIEKCYPGGKAAVRNVSVGVKEGHCFGLLGINGAGKTTTFKMLTGEFFPSAGDAYVKGAVTGEDGARETLSITSDLARARQHLGYCPQFDGIHPNMTARELLKFYARIRGLPDDEVEAAVNGLIKKMKLTKYQDRPCGTYSGGNKRKLSVAVALVGDPPIVLLDEPSTGMDPQARRFMWDVISGSLQGRCIVLTSHSMEECEALCHRLVIMVSGRFRCLGSVQHLKDKYGRGYFLDVRVKPEHLGALQAWVEHTLPTANVHEVQDTHVKYHVSVSGAEVGRLFEAVETVRADGPHGFSIEDYSLTQTTLEQIFVQFAAEQSEESTAPGMRKSFERPVPPTELTFEVPEGTAPGAKLTVPLASIAAPKPPPAVAAGDGAVKNMETVELGAHLPGTRR